MKYIKTVTAALSLCSITAAAAHSQNALTIYNQKFAVVRRALKLNLKEGTTDIQVSDITRHLEPQSVIVRDSKGQTKFTITEQSYRADQVSQGLLLSVFEGQSIDFMVGRTNIVRGTILRSGYTPHYQAMSRYGRQYTMSQYAYSSSQEGGRPIIKVDGKIRFGLPGMPLFPSLPDDSILKPTLSWKIWSQKQATIDAELCYITGGMSWSADYNMIAPKTGDVVDVIGWVTIDNQCGMTFKDTKIKLMAGDISKINQQAGRQYAFRSISSCLAAEPQSVSEKVFDEYHLYTMPRRTTIRDRETKQIEFVRASNVRTRKIYIYDGAAIDKQRYSGYSYNNIRNQRDYGTKSNTKVMIMRECENTKANNLGIALPKGKVRFYRHDTDNQLEFLGENIIDHTPNNENLRFYTGNAFDLTGERKRTAYKIDRSQNWAEESFEIKVRNHKQKDAVEIRVLEHLYRGANWKIVESSHTYLKTDSQTIEFHIKPPAGEETTITYKVRYTW